MSFFNPLNKFCKSITGAICEGEKLTLRVKGNFNRCDLIVRKDGEDFDRFFGMENKGDFFEREISFSRGLYFYAFRLEDGKFIGLGEDYEGVISSEPQAFQFTVYSKDFISPEWIKGGVIYQIFPDRFCRGEKDKKTENGKILHSDWKELPIFKPNSEGKVVNNDFFGGDFKGIISKLGYLKELGVTAVYLNPIFKAYSNHRYDTGDYMQTDPLLGSEEDFLKLIEEAKKNGIRLIIDGVFNHTGDDSVYFNKYGNYDSVGAFQSKDSQYINWYKFINYPDEYESWWGITVLPALNKTHPDYVDFITGKGGVIEKYAKMGVGGWRLDVVDELPDDFVKKIRQAVKGADKNGFIIGEVWEDATNKISYGKRREYFIGEELDSVMNYPLKDAIIDYVLSGNCAKIAYTVKEQTDHYPHFSLNLLMNILSTHDTFRILSALGGIDVCGMTKEEQSRIKIPYDKIKEAKFRVKVAALLQYTLCGVPSVYYGDEIGMQGYTDPLNRMCFTWDDIDDELLGFYKTLGKLRNEYKVFEDGEQEVIYEKDGVFAFKRFTEKSEIMIAINLSDKEKTINFAGEILKDLISGKSFTDRLSLKPQSFAVLANK